MSEQPTVYYVARFVLAMTVSCFHTHLSSITVNLLGKDSPQPKCMPT